MLKSIFTIVFVCFIFLAYSQKRISPEDYINKYNRIAIEEMKRSGIPASITLSQGMLESDNGNSMLSLKSNNHFGIKCHNWDGAKVFHDDDKDNECFRKYSSAEESYRDHTDFLMNGKRYAFLFEYKSTDYKKWAKGLKKAGYATNSHYSNKLIQLIEQYELYKFDQGFSSTNKNKKTNNEEFVVRIKRRKVIKFNDIDCILAKEGETLASITKEFNKMNFELPRYNDLPKDTILHEGQRIYLQPKRRSAEKGIETCIAERGETMYSISQKYGIKLRILYRKNRMEKGTQPLVGQKIWLRDKKPRKTEN
jgi:LysM repeat protein